MGAVMLVCLSCSHFSGSLSPCLSAGPVSPVLRSNVELRGGYHEYTEVQSCQDVVYLYHLLWSATILNIIALFLGIITAAVLGGFKDMVRAKGTRVVGWEGMCVLVSWELVKKLAIVKSLAEPLSPFFMSVGFKGASSRNRKKIGFLIFLLFQHVHKRPMENYSI